MEGGIGRERDELPTKYTLDIHCRYDPSEGMSAHVFDGDDDFSKYHVWLRILFYLKVCIFIL